MLGLHHPGDTSPVATGNESQHVTPSLLGFYAGYNGNTGLSNTRGARYSAAQVAYVLGQPSLLDHWHDRDTHDAMSGALAYAYLSGGRSYDEGPICGVYAVCVSDVAELSEGDNTMTVGLVILSERSHLSPWLQFHEFTHVIDEMDGGWARFSDDYARGAWYASLRGDDIHDGNGFERSANRVAGKANERYMGWLAGADPSSLRLLPPNVISLYRRSWYD